MFVVSLLLSSLLSPLWYFMFFFSFSVQCAVFFRRLRSRSSRSVLGFRLSPARVEVGRFRKGFDLPLIGAPEELGVLVEGQRLVEAQEGVGKLALGLVPPGQLRCLPRLLRAAKPAVKHV